MPIITPAFPAMNSSFNVSYSTRKVIVEELWRGKNIVEKVGNGGMQWPTLFEKDDFFLRYKGYFQFDVVAETEELHHKWFALLPLHAAKLFFRESFVKSKIWSLTLSLERKSALDCFHPYPNFLDKSKSPPKSTSIFIGKDILCTRPLILNRHDC